MHHRTPFGLLALAVSCAALSCGGSSHSDLFDPPGSGGSASGLGGSGDMGGASGTGGTGTSGTGGDGISAGSGGSAGGFDGAAPGDSSVGFDATSSDAQDGSLLHDGEGPSDAADAGPGTSKGQVACGNSSCHVEGGGYCCIPVGGNGSGFSTSTCNPSGAAACSLGQATVRCAGPENCSDGDVCCGTYTLVFGVPVFSDLHCAGASSCTGLGHSVFCNTSGPNTCPQGSCQQTAVLPGYSLCQ